MAGAYYNDPSGLGSWWVPAGETPAQALQDTLTQTGATVSPILTYSVANTPAAQVAIGAPTPLPPAPTLPPPTVLPLPQPLPVSTPPGLYPFVPKPISVSTATHKPGILTSRYIQSAACPGQLYDPVADQCVDIPSDVDCSQYPGTYYDYISDS